jgi:sulfatase maturation enzyme AslB (radical SAM superfamily)
MAESLERRIRPPTAHDPVTASIAHPTLDRSDRFNYQRPGDIRFEPRYSLEEAFMHLTKRLRVYELPPDRHLVCNALTGEVSVIGSEVYQQMQALKEGRVEECSTETMRLLEERKLAFKSSEDEDATFRQLMDKAYFQYLQTARTEYCFTVNTHCNFNCVYCFEAEDLRAYASTLSEDQLDAAFRLIDDEHSAQPGRPEPRFTLYGGEPLLAPSKPTVVSLLERIAARGHRTHIITNGHALSRFFDVFDLYHETIESLQMTIDGIETDHDQRRVLRSGAGTFSKITDNIDAFLQRDYRTRCFIRTSFDRASLPHVYALKQFLDERGWSKDRRVSVVPVTIQDHSSCESAEIEGLTGYADLLEAVLPYSTDLGGDHSTSRAFMSSATCGTSLIWRREGKLPPHSPLAQLSVEQPCGY